MFELFSIFIMVFKVLFFFNLLDCDLSCEFLNLIVVDVFV